MLAETAVPLADLRAENLSRKIGDVEEDVEDAKDETTLQPPPRGLEQVKSAGRGGRGH